MSSTSGGYTRQLRLFLSRHKRADTLETTSSSTDANKQAKSHRKSSEKQKKSKSLRQTERNCNNNSCDNSSQCPQKSGLNVEPVTTSSDSPKLLGLPLKQHNQPVKPRHHRRSYSLNDITLLLEIFDNICGTSSESKTDGKCSTFRRTLSYFSGKSIIRRKQKLKTKMGQNASNASPPDTNPPNTGTAGHTLKADKSKDNVSADDLAQVKEELRQTKMQLYDRDQQLLRLHREIHKMKSVLEQTSLSTINRSSGGTSSSGSVAGAGPAKKCGVSGECYSESAQHLPVTKVSKDYRSKQLIKEALLDNSFLRHFLDTHQLKLIVDAMYEREFAKNCLICKQGMPGSHLYVIAYGHCQIIDNKNQLVNQLGPGKAFGELALLYNCSRTATVKALTKVRTWVLDRRAFQVIMMKTGKDKTIQYKKFLQSVPLLKDINEEITGKIADAIEVDYYPAGDYICRQGCSGDSFYIISSGSVKVTQHNFNGEETLRTLSVGDYFGEQALLVNSSSALRTANVVSLDCECLVLDRNNFHSLIGDLNELKNKFYEDRDVFHSADCSEAEETIDPLVADLKLDDLETVTTLGVGGFGKVDLVRNKRNASQVFALKSCSKAFVRSTRQEQHINNERVVQRLAAKHQFVVKLFRTFKDEFSVYFLMEAALGGELWTLLRHRGAFDELSSRFYVGCVVEALQYLHSHQIIYRDLKPENCLLDRTGYLKLTDFGFAKIITGNEKTWTFCGTPEYVAPEIILNKGHDQAVDFWSIGILLYELLTGLPPFTSPDPLKTYNIILRGFDAIGFSEAIFSKNCVNLIRRLCKENPSERIGVQKNGYSELKSHKWFSGFDWDNLVRRAIKPPIVPRLNSPTDTHYFDLTTDQTVKEIEFDLKEGVNDTDLDYDSSWDKYF